MIDYLRERRILLPAAVTLEKIALATRALARKRAHKTPFCAATQAAKQRSKSHAQTPPDLSRAHPTVVQPQQCSQHA
jgi:hypothetical protein